MKPASNQPASSWLLILVVVLSASAAPARHSAPATTAGVISSDTTWARAITITRPITVTSEATLTIEPGVEVHFYPGTWLRVEGWLDGQMCETWPVGSVCVNGLLSTYE